MPAWKSKALTDERTDCSVTDRQCDRPFPIYLGRVLLSQIRHRYAHMLTGPLPFFLRPFGPSFPASVVRIFSLNGVSRSAAPPGSSVVREKKSVSSSVRPCGLRGGPCATAEGGRKGAGGRRRRVKSEICAYRLSLVPFPNQCRTREKEERHFRYETVCW